MPARVARKVNPFKPSGEIFSKFVSVDANGKLNTSKILSAACFNEWIKSRKIVPKNPARAFKDALKAKILAKNRCCPFPAEVERDLLKRLRNPDDYLKSGDEAASLGKRPWTIKGFHERVAEHQDRIDINMLYNCKPFPPLEKIDDSSTEAPPTPHGFLQEPPIVPPLVPQDFINSSFVPEPLTFPDAGSENDDAILDFLNVNLMTVE